MRGDMKLHAAEPYEDLMFSHVLLTSNGNVYLHQFPPEILCPQCTIPTSLLRSHAPQEKHDTSGKKFAPSNAD